jgi:hypothetical protein
MDLGKPLNHPLFLARTLDRYAPVTRRSVAKPGREGYKHPMSRNILCLRGSRGAADGATRAGAPVASAGRGTGVPHNGGWVVPAQTASVVSPQPSQAMGDQLCIERRW